MTVCPYCLNEVYRAAPDAIEVCRECERVVEGRTIELEDEDDTGTQ